MHSTWSLGVLVGLPITAVVVVASLALIAWFVVDGWPGGAAATGSFLALVLAIALSPLGFYPYAAQYHRWVPTTGTIDQIDRRLLADGDSMSERFVVRYTDGRERSCDDTRCALLHSGDHLNLMCKRQWQFAGLDGFNCNYVSANRKAVR